MRAVTITNIGSIDCICHQDVEKPVIQRPTRLENLEPRKNDLDISSNGSEPCLFFEPLLRSTLGHALIQLLGSLQGFRVGTVGHRQVVSDRSLPNLGSGARSHAAPPEFSGSGLANDLFPVRQHMLFPNTRECVFGIVLSASQIGCLGRLLVL